MIIADFVTRKFEPQLLTKLCQDTIGVQLSQTLGNATPVFRSCDRKAKKYYRRACQFGILRPENWEMPEDNLFIECDCPIRGQCCVMDATRSIKSLFKCR